MSNPSDLPNDYESANKYYNWLVSLNIFDKIYLSGSRSPKRTKQPEEHSDWDFIGLTSKVNLQMLRPRQTRTMHADLGIVEEESKVPNKAVEIYPTDDYRIFTNVS